MSKIKSTRPGRVTSFPEATAAFNEVDITLSQLLQQALTTTDVAPVAGTFFLPVMDSTGTVTLWKFVAGAGMTITPNAGAKTFTFTSP